MDIRQLQFLCALEQHRHFGRAAEACHVTQPTLSMRLRSLEEELNVTLIRRKQRFEGFTEEGERLLSWAKQAVSAFEGMKTEAQRLQGELVGTLRIGMVPLSHVGLLQSLQQLRLEAPQVRFQLHSLSSQQIFEQLENNHLDIGLTYLSQIELSHYQVQPLGSPTVGLLYNPAYYQPLIKQQNEHEHEHENKRQAAAGIRWQQLTDLPLGLLTDAMHFRQELNRSAQLQGVDLQPVLESDSVEHLLEAANSGLCCTLIPLPAPRSVSCDTLSVVALADTQPQAALALVCQHTVYSSHALVQALMQRVAVDVLHAPAFLTGSN